MVLRRQLWFVIAFALTVKIVLALWLPLTGDEAYYIMWGKNLDWGYYDQPPMIGWWTALLLTVSHHILWLRLPAILLSIFVAFGIYSLLKKSESEERASLTALLYLLAPLHMLFVFITTDIPLVFFSFLSIYLFEIGRKKEEPTFFIFSGLFLGLGVLSKYFVAFVPIAYGVYFLFHSRKRMDWLGLGLMCLMTLPFIAIHLLWNRDHCWINFVFNLSSRTEGESLSFDKFRDFLGYQLYLATPFFIYFLLKVSRKTKPLLSSRVYAVLFLVPIAIFALTSFKIAQGLHWTLAFYPAFYLWIGTRLPTADLKRSVKWMWAYLLPHFIPIIAFAVIPTKHWEGKWFYKNLQLFLHTDDATRHLTPYERDYFFASDGYTLSSILGYRSSQHFSVFGVGSKFGRQDDLITDFRKMNGQKILIFSRGTENMHIWKNYFKTSQIKRIESFGIPYFFMLGDGFKYEAYKRDYLVKLRDKYYQIPPALSPRSCYFLDKYFQQDR